MTSVVKQLVDMQMHIQKPCARMVLSEHALDGNSGQSTLNGTSAKHPVVPRQTHKPTATAETYTSLQHHYHHQAHSGHDLADDAFGVPSLALSTS